MIPATASNHKRRAKGIPEGERNSTLSCRAGGILKRYADDSKTLKFCLLNYRLFREGVKILCIVNVSEGNGKGW